MATSLSAAVVAGEERLLSVREVGVMLGTGDRFPRRLIAERRFTFVRAGRHVRIPESSVRALLDAGTVSPITTGERREWASELRFGARVAFGARASAASRP